MPILKELCDLYGKTSSEIKLMVQNGEIDFNHFGAVFIYLTNDGGMFYELKKKQSQTWGYQYNEAFKKLIIEAYNAGYSHCENDIGSYSAEDYYNDTFEKNKSLN